MRRETSLYLDLGRILAALAVFIHNAKKENITSGFLAPLGQFGNEAVIIFFVISGVVIAYVADSGEDDPVRYALARLSRLWSVIIPAVVVTIILDSLGSRIDPTIYDAFPSPPWKFDASSVWQAVAPIVFLNQVWLWPTGPGTNGPFWSIGYEAWYYIGFGLIVFLRGSARLLCVVAAAALVGPSIVLLSLPWVLGIIVFHLLGKGKTSKTAWTTWVSTLFIMMAFYGLKYKIITLTHYIIFGTIYFSNEFEYVFPITAIALIFAINIASFDRISCNFTHLGDRLSSIIRFLAARTFSLYLYQAPLLFFFGACSAHVTSLSGRIAIVYLGTITSVFLLAELSERRKQTVSRWLAAIGARLGLATLPVARPEGEPRRSI